MAGSSKRFPLPSATGRGEDWPSRPIRSETKRSDSMGSEQASQHSQPNIHQVVSSMWVELARSGATPVTTQSPTSGHQRRSRWAGEVREGTETVGQGNQQHGQVVSEQVRVDQACREDHQRELRAPGPASCRRSVGDIARQRSPESRGPTRPSALWPPSSPIRTATTRRRAENRLNVASELRNHWSECNWPSGSGSRRIADTLEDSATTPHRSSRKL